MNINDPEMKRQIEEKRQEALRRRAKVLQQMKSGESSSSTSSSNRFSPYPLQNPSKPQSSDILRNVNNNSVASAPKPPVVNNVQAPVNPPKAVPRPNPWMPKMPASNKLQRPSPYMQPNQPRPQQQPTPPIVTPTVNSVPQPVRPSNQPQKSVPYIEPAKQSNQPSTSTAAAPKKEIKCTVEIISEQRFQVRTSIYDQAVIDEMRKIPSKSWNPTNKVWSFLLSDYKLLVSSLEAKFKSLVKIEKIPDFVIRNMLRPSPPLDESCLTNIDPKLLDTLMQFQKAAVIFGISRNGRVLLCDDPGLGKTRQALGIASFYRDDGAVLIITNASTREFWKNEIHNVFNVRDKDVRIIPAYLEEARYVICSYNALDQHINELINKNFGIIIFDESHNIKNPKALQTKNAQKLGKIAKRVICLSGTPALSRPVELFPQLEIIDGTFATFNQYAVRYCNGHQTNFGFNTTGSSNMGELEVFLKKRFMIRRIKSEVFEELQNKQRECVTLENLSITEDEQENMEDFKSQMGTRIDNASAKDEVLLRWYNSTAQLKAKGVCAYIENLLTKTDEKILAFGHHAVMLNAISTHLGDLKIGHVRIDGTTSGPLRSERIETFQSNPNIRVAVLSTLATNAGITLTSASIVLFCELEFNPSTIIQAEGRAHRIGQKNQVKVHFLLAPGTADDVIWKMLMKKQANLGKAGLVDSIEYLSNTMKVSKFNCQPTSEESSNDQGDDSNDSSETTGTFYSCASPPIAINPPAPKSQVKDIDEFEMNSQELEEIRRLEEEIMNGTL